MPQGTGRLILALVQQEVSGWSPAEFTNSHSTPNYTYSWLSYGKTGATGSTFQVSGLANGSYSLTITDANGCKDSIVPILISQAPPLSAILDSTFNLKCNGATNGFIAASVSGGSGSYTY